MKSNEKYKKEDLEYMIFEKKLSYIQIGKFYGVSDNFIKKICKKLNIVLPIRSKFPDNWVPHNKGKLKTNICIACNKEYISKHKISIYCSKECNIQHKIDKNYDYYLSNQTEFVGKIKNMRFVKKHILKEQNYTCLICDNKNEWQDNELIFVLDHIDGNAANNSRENLRLICPNCDSQLSTYKSKNKNSARKQRYLLNYKNLK